MAEPPQQVGGLLGFLQDNLDDVRRDFPGEGQHFVTILAEICRHPDNFVFAGRGGFAPFHIGDEIGTETHLMGEVPQGVPSLKPQEPHECAEGFFHAVNHNVDSVEISSYALTRAALKIQIVLTPVYA
jgi:hypothetical protein